jgi:hypothetical protein
MTETPCLTVLKYQRSSYVHANPRLKPMTRLRGLRAAHGAGYRCPASTLIP